MRHETIARRMEQEVLALSCLRHLNITRSYGVLDAAGHACLLLELVDGPDLGSWLLDARWWSPLSQRLDIFAGLLRGVAHAHHHGVVHRDL